MVSNTHGVQGHTSVFSLCTQLLTSRLVAGYAAPGTPKIVLIESGTDPALPPLRRLLDSDAVAKADATFAYASVQGKGMVILRLGNAVK